MAGADEIEAAIRRLSRLRLLIGIPQEKDPRQGEPIGNASLGYIHEFGSPARNIPPRPFLIPGVRAALPQITDKLRAGAREALRGDEQAIRNRMGEAGAEGVRSVTRGIQAGGPPGTKWPALKPATVARRRQRSPGSSYRRKAQTAADVTPLIDTGALIRSVTWVIRNK